MSILSHTNNINNNALPIGFFDSGVGGLSVYSRFKKLLPCENTLYFGDLLNLPYGNKSKDELIKFARNILDFYEKKGVKAVVIACNTSSAQAYDTIKDEYDFKIYPIIQSCAKVISSMDISRIGVFATEATVKAGVYTSELKKHNSSIEVKEIPCPNWVSIVEGNYGNNNPLEDIEAHVKSMLEFNPDKIVLGCTHYPYLINSLKKFAPEDLFIDPAEIFVRYIKEDLRKNNLLNPHDKLGEEEIFVSANPEKFIQNSKIFYEVKKLPTVINSIQ